MIPYRSTPVPNIIFDYYLPVLKPAELTLLLIIIRQTIGWQNANSQRRKYNDWLSGSQLREKTGYSRKAITTAIDGLVYRRLIRVQNEYGKVLSSAAERQGKLRLYYAYCGDNPVDTESPPEHQLLNPCVKSRTNMYTYYAQQKKLLQKKMNLPYQTNEKH